MEQSNNNSNIISLGGNTPLMIACSNRKDKEALLLIQQEIDLSLKNDDNQNAIMLAAQYYSSSKVIEALLEKGGFDINDQDNNGETVLMLLARNLNPIKMQILLKYNPDLSIKNSLGQKAIDIANCWKNTDIIELLSNKIEKSSE